MTRDEAWKRWFVLRGGPSGSVSMHLANHDGFVAGWDAALAEAAEEKTRPRFDSDRPCEAPVDVGRCGVTPTTRVVIQGDRGLFSANAHDRDTSLCTEHLADLQREQEAANPTETP